MIHSRYDSKYKTKQKHSLYTILTHSGWQLATVLNIIIFWLPSSNKTTRCKTKYNENSLAVHNINNISEQTTTLLCIHATCISVQNVDNYFKFDVHVIGNEHILSCP